MSKRLAAVNDRVVLKMDAKPATVGGLYTVDLGDDVPQFGKVINVGPEVDNVKSGFSVVVAKHAGLPVEIDNQKFVVVGEKDILAIVLNDEEAIHAV